MASGPIMVGIGELLWDILPEGPRPGGAPANFAWMSSQLGGVGRIVSAVGNDALGKELMTHLRRQKIPTDFIAVLDEYPTGTVTVQVDSAGQAKYLIHEEVAWDYLPSTTSALDLASKADAVCLGTLAQRSAISQATIQEFLDAISPECLSIFDLNLRQNYYDATSIRQTLTKSQVLKMNQEEWPILAAMLGLNENFTYGLPALIDRYGLQLIALTLGANGSVLASSGGLSVAEGLEVTVLDSIGAGDAFTAALAVGLLRGDPIKQIQQKASKIAAYVCTQSGATPVLPPAFNL